MLLFDIKRRFIPVTLFGFRLVWAHAYLVLECSCEVLTPFTITVVTASMT